MFTDVTAAAHNGDFTWSQAGFKCASTLNITGFNAGMKTKLDFLLTHDVQIEAFRSKKDTDFGKGKSVVLVQILFIFLLRIAL